MKKLYKRYKIRNSILMIAIVLISLSGCTSSKKTTEEGDTGAWRRGFCFWSIQKKTRMFRYE